MNANPAECALHRDAVPAYVDYVLTGCEIPDRAGVEEHCTVCTACATTYADLLGIKVVDEVEQILDLTLGMNPSSEEDRIRRALGALSLDLALSSSLHWLDVSRNGLAPDEHSSASALACIGAVLELKGKFREALDRYDEAAVLVRRVDNGYARVRAASGKGRVLAGMGRKGEAIVSLRAACRDGLEMNDSFGVARDYLAIGDALRDSKGVPGRLEALRCYGRSTRIASEIGYHSGRAAAEARLRDCKESVAVFFRDLVGRFVRDHFKKEASLLDEFCRAFFSGLGNAFGSGMPLAPQPIHSRLGFSATAGDIRTMALLSTVVITFEEIAARGLPASIEEAAAAVPTGGVLAGHQREIQNDIARAIGRVASEQGLSRSESGRLTKYLAQRLAGDPELLDDIEFATVDS